MRFEKVTEDNFEKIKKYLDGVDYGTCDLTPLCVYFWGTDRYCFAEEKNTLFLRMCFKGGFKGYFPPVSKERDFCDMIEEILSRGGKTVFFGITDDLLSLLKEGEKQGVYVLNNKAAVLEYAQHSDIHDNCDQ